MTNGRGRWFAPLALAVAPCAFLVTISWLRHVRGPAWLAFNSDPEYVYLMNSLAMLKGYPPFHIDHPGIPLKAIGAIVIAIIYTVSGAGHVVLDVVMRPEVYIAGIQWTAAIVSALLIATAGVLVWRRAGLTAALLVQASPWLSFTTVSVSGGLRIEALLAGTVVLWTALVVGYVQRPTRSAPLLIGLVTGVMGTLHVAAAPLALGAFLLFDNWQSRRRMMIAAIFSFLAAFSPALTKLPSFVKRIAMVSVHSGYYGSGSVTVVDVDHYLPGLRFLLLSEPVCTAVILLGAVTWVVWRIDDGPREGGLPRRGLGALAAMQVAAVVALAKHADPHYLVPTYCTLGATLWMVGRYVRGRAPSGFVPASVVVAVFIVAGQSELIQAEVVRLTTLRIDQERAVSRVEDLMRQGPCDPIYVARSSNVASALQMGNLCALYKGHALFGEEIEQRFPAVLFDEGGLIVGKANRQAVELDPILRGERCVIYAGETVHVPALPSQVELEWLGQSGPESVYRMRPGRKPAR